MRRLLATLAFSAFAFSALAGEGYSVSETDIETLMDDPAASAIIQKYLPKTSSDSQFSMTYGLTLEFIKSFDQHGELTDENMEKIQSELSKLPAK